MPNSFIRASIQAVVASVARLDDGSHYSSTR
jgi:hypothetical protein